jgi:hypothetical protein
MNHNTEAGTTRLTRGQIAVLTAATLPMVAFGGLGGWGTYANIVSVFDRSATALGVVAAGEGATLVLALVAVGLVMLGQSVPAPVRVGLWALPAVASATGAAVAETVTEAVVFAVTPMAMTVSAEGMGLLARRIVVFRTGVDAEAQRRNAATVQRLAYHRARAANHPSSRSRWLSERASWRLARRVGVGDAQLGARLVEVQRDRLTEGANAALSGMFDTAPAIGQKLPTSAETDRDDPVNSMEPVPHPAPEVVPPGVRLLPLVAHPEPADTATEFTIERTDQPPSIKVPPQVPDAFADKAYKALPPASPEPDAEPVPELTAIGFLARRHKVRPDQIRTAVDLLAEQPAMSGKAIGEALETTDRYGRRVLAAAKELAGVRP